MTNFECQEIVQFDKECPIKQKYDAIKAKIAEIKERSDYINYCLVSTVVDEIEEVGR